MILVEIRGCVSHDALFGSCSRWKRVCCRPPLRLPICCRRWRPMQALVGRWVRVTSRCRSEHPSSSFTVWRFLSELRLSTHDHDYCTAGILHLLGYDHENDEDFQTMTKEEERVLRAMTNSPPSPPVPDQAVPVATATSKTKKRNVRKEDPKAK